MAGKRNRGLRTLHDVLGGMLARGPFAQQMRTARLRTAWKAAAGDRASRETLPVTLRRGTLVVGVSSPVWSQELAFEQGRIIAVIQERFPEEKVQRIVYKAMNQDQKEKGGSD